MSSSKPEAPDDAGAFGVLRPREVALLNGAAYKLTARIAHEPRIPEQWDTWFCRAVHRDLFRAVFPREAGVLRWKDVSYRHHVICRPAQVLERLDGLCHEARAIIQEAARFPIDKRLEYLLERISVFHARCVILQPFIDGNKRWSRQVLSAILVDIGYGPGTMFHLEQKEIYLDAIDKTIDGSPEQLGNLIMRGYIELVEIFRTGAY